MCKSAILVTHISAHISSILHNAFYYTFYIHIHDYIHKVWIQTKNLAWGFFSETHSNDDIVRLWLSNAFCEIFNNIMVVKNVT